jgi:hypothetical protein
MRLEASSFDASTFSKNRERLAGEEVALGFFGLQPGAHQSNVSNYRQRLADGCGRIGIFFGDM